MSIREPIGGHPHLNEEALQRAADKQAAIERHLHPVSDLDPDYGLDDSDDSSEPPATSPQTEIPVDPTVGRERAAQARAALEEAKRRTATQDELPTLPRTPNADDFDEHGDLKPGWNKERTQ